MKRVCLQVSWSLVTVLFLPGGQAFAQAPQEVVTAVEIGTRVRVQTKDAAEMRATFVGDVVAVTEDEVIVTLDGRAAKFAIPRSAITQVERSQGKVRVGSRSKGALKGLALGAAAGWLVGELFRNTDAGEGDAKDKSNLFAVLFGVTGGATGAFRGSDEVEQWKGASFEAPKTTPLVISRRGFGASIRISF